MELGLLLLLVYIFLSGVFSGSETGLYSVSRVRVELDAHAGRRTARWMQWLLSNDTVLLITVLIGNNLVIELATHETEHLLSASAVWPEGREILVTLVLTPVVFFFGEILPKELFRRRPYPLLSGTVVLIAAARWLFWPLERALYGVTWVLAKALKLEEGALRRTLDRELVLELFRESHDVPAPVEDLASNVLRLRAVRLASVMIPWERVETLDAGLDEAELHARVAGSPYSRLPVVGPEGARGYLLQIEVLARGPESPVLDSLRPLEYLSPRTPVSRALARMRMAGLRATVVGSAEDPIGWVTLKDLLEEISGDLADW